MGKRGKSKSKSSKKKNLNATQRSIVKIKNQIVQGDVHNAVSAASKTLLRLAQKKDFQRISNMYRKYQFMLVEHVANRRLSHDLQLQLALNCLSLQDHIAGIGNDFISRAEYCYSQSHQTKLACTYFETGIDILLKKEKYSSITKEIANLTNIKSFGFGADGYIYLDYLFQKPNPHAENNNREWLIIITDFLVQVQEKLQPFHEKFGMIEWLTFKSGFVEYNQRLREMYGGDLETQLKYAERSIKFNFEIFTRKMHPLTTFFKIQDIRSRLDHISILIELERHSIASDNLTLIGYELQKVKRYIESQSPNSELARLIRKVPMILRQYDSCIVLYDHCRHRLSAVNNIPGIVTLRPDENGQITWQPVASYKLSHLLTQPGDATVDNIEYANMCNQVIYSTAHMLNVNKIRQQLTDAFNTRPATLFDELNVIMRRVEGNIIHFEAEIKQGNFEHVKEILHASYAQMTCCTFWISIPDVWRSNLDKMLRFSELRDEINYPDYFLAKSASLALKNFENKCPDLEFELQSFKSRLLVDEKPSRMMFALAFFIDCMYLRTMMFKQVGIARLNQSFQSLRTHLYFVINMLDAPLCQTKVIYEFMAASEDFYKYCSQTFDKDNLQFKQLGRYALVESAKVLEWVNPDSYDRRCPTYPRKDEMRASIQARLVVLEKEIGDIILCDRIKHDDSLLHADELLNEIRAEKSARDKALEKIRQQRNTRKRARKKAQNMRLEMTKDKQELDDIVKPESSQPSASTRCFIIKLLPIEKAIDNAEKKQVEALKKQTLLYDERCELFKECIALVDLAVESCRKLNVTDSEQKALRDQHIESCEVILDCARSRLHNINEKAKRTVDKLLRNLEYLRRHGKLKKRKNGTFSPAHHLRVSAEKALTKCGQTLNHIEIIQGEINSIKSSKIIESNQHTFFQPTQKHCGDEEIEGFPTPGQAYRGEQPPR